MDNPNYEEYCLLFHELTGVFPPTTTAIPHKHPDRIRRLLQLAREHNSWLTRFSVLSVSLMNKVHQMFTAEELSIAECLPLNREGSFAYGVAGRYRDYLKKHPEVLVQQQERLHNAPFYQDVKDHLDSDTHAHGSIACVTGFLVNLVDCSVSLIAPTHATDEFPLGYITFASGTFTESENIQSVINDVVTRGRINTPAGTMMCILAPYISYETLEGDVVFTGRLGTRVRAADLGSSTNVSLLMQTLREGGRNHTEILSMFPDDQQWIEYALERLWTMGVLLEPVAC
jgi:hypothetical protein